eukprot:6173430-Pleurochrysis_carterae.AAC.1
MLRDLLPLRRRLVNLRFLVIFISAATLPRAAVSMRCPSWKEERGEKGEGWATKPGTGVWRRTGSSGSGEGREWRPSTHTQLPSRLHAAVAGSRVTEPAAAFL